MSQVQKVASRLSAKLAQMSGIRPYDMGTLDKPNFNNIVKNIQNLVDGFNYLSFEVNEMNKKPAAQSAAGNDVVQQLDQAGVKITQL
jgi:hypothetical protein